MDTKKSLWDRWSGYTSLPANILGILGFLGFSVPFALWLHSKHPGTSQQKQAINKDTGQSRSNIPQEPKSIPLPDTIGKAIETPISPKKDSIKYIPVDSTGIAVDTTANSRVEVVTLDPSSSSAIASDNDHATTVQMSYDPVPKGYGRLALRSYCAHCYFTCAFITVNYHDSTSTMWRQKCLAAKYDSLHKNSSTLIADLLPGKYDVLFDYRELGNHVVTVNIKEGKTYLCRCRNLNPYGPKNGEIFFVSGNSKRNWRITIDKKPLGIVTLYPNKGLSVVVEAGNHEYLIQNPTPNELDFNDEKNYVIVHEGERKHIIIK